ncbi:MAG: glycosyltransferase [Deltaproteobacteria bacterium]|nr:glycosyltransferase [Deltaproteobacteria bacterium]
MAAFDTTVIALYFAVLGLLALFGLHRLWLVLLYWRASRRPRPIAPVPVELPRITVQLPLYNERFVAGRLIDAVARLDYPRDRFQVQVLDDSTDDTRDVVAAAVDRWRALGVDIEQVRRGDRTGYKAGALENGLRTASGEIVAIFDADFVPEPDFLRRTVGEFDDPAVGMVQARWGHLNIGDSILTRVQAMMLNGHFVVEHTARWSSGRFFNFNGTAGLFRKSCIAAAGGWEHDTLTEDLDLSYRAQLQGWKFVYRPDVTAAAELPGSITAFKSQQFRWTKGSIQTARKLLGRVLSSRVPPAVRIEACFHLLNNSAYLLLTLLAALLPLAIAARADHGMVVALAVDLPIFIFSTVSIGIFFVVSEAVIGGRWWWRALLLPLVFAVGIGICINNGRAVLEALLGRESPFLRTPKTGRDPAAGRNRRREGGYRSLAGWMPLVELAFAAYYGVALVHAALAGQYLSLPWCALFFIGFAVVGGSSLIEAARQQPLFRLAAASLR